MPIPIKENSNKGKLIRNAIICPDGTFLESRSVHDYREHVQEDGRMYSTDGGLEYQVINHSDNDYENLAIYENDSHKTIRNKFYWGNRGINGDQPLKYLPIKVMDDSHIKNIINLNFTSGRFLQILKDELKFRNNK